MQEAGDRYPRRGQFLHRPLVRLKRLHPKSLVKPAIRSILVPKPQAGTGFDKRDKTDTELIDWVTGVLDQILPAPDLAPAAPDTAEVPAGTAEASAGTSAGTA